MIESVKLVIQGKEFDLTLVELQELQQDIEKIFPKTPTFNPQYYQIYPNPVLPSYPYYPSPPTVWYGNDMAQPSTEFTTIATVELTDKEYSEREGQVANWITAYQTSQHTRKTGFDL